MAMNKQEFLAQLRNRLSGLPQKDMEDRLTFYSEMIEDRMEDGLSEEEAVAAVGTVDEIAKHIIKDIPLTKIAIEKIKPKRRLKTWEIVLLIAGAPLWIPLTIAFFAVILALYVSLWSIIVSLWAGFASVVSCALSGIVAGAGIVFTPNKMAGIALLGIGIVCAGLSILLFLGCKAATDGVVILTKKIVFFIKNRLTKKEEA
jgi:uncharacterized membrane protein